MSSYTSIEINLKTKHYLSKDDIELIKKKLEGHCCDLIFNVEKDKVEIGVTFNYGLNKTIELIKTLENLIEYQEISEVGYFKTEDIPKLSYSRIFAYKNKIFIVKQEDGEGFVQTDSYYITDLRENKEYYHVYFDEKEHEECEDRFIKDFIKKSYRLAI